MSEISCCAYFELMSNSDPNGVASARTNVADAMRHLRDIKFEGPSEIYHRGPASMEKRCEENKTNVANAINALTRLMEKIESIIQQVAPYKAPYKAPREALCVWIDAIANLWERLHTLHQAFTRLQRANGRAAGLVVVRQIRWNMAEVNEQIGKCNNKRSECITSITCSEHEGGLPLFGT